MQSFRTLLTIFVAVFVLLGYQFIGATWSAPTAVPTGGNVLPPINVGTSTQVKDGNLNANILQSVSGVWSDLYCDSVGENCFTGDQIYLLIAQSASSSPNCTYETITVVGCQAAPACPAGYTAVGAPNRQVASCGSSNQHDRYTQTCGRNVCTQPATLVNGQHTEAQCTALGGTVIVDGSNRFCRFNQASCPAGWAAFQQWSTFTAGNVSGTCQRDGSPQSYTAFCNASRAWANAGAPSGFTSQCGQLLTCTPPRTQIGCY